MSIKHLSIAEYGTYLSLKGARLLVQNGKDIIGEYPLNRLRTVSIARSGVSFSSNLLCECANRGIRFFIFNFNRQAAVCLSGMHQHGVVAVRRAQFNFIETEGCFELASQIVYGKIRNQRSTLLYFSKYLSKTNVKYFDMLSNAAKRISLLAQKIKKMPYQKGEIWRYELLGLEGQAAAVYWDALKKTHLLGPQFTGRKKRGADDTINQGLNIGYAVLSSYVWNAIINAGLEGYAGCLHVDRPGKPALVLDLMEEYRSWVVDRSVAKLRSHFDGEKQIQQKLKIKLISEIHSVFAKRYPYKNKKIRLENILQRQVYRLSGVFVENKKYSPHIFRW